MKNNFTLTIALIIGILIMSIATIYFNFQIAHWVSKAQGYDTFVYYKGHGTRCKTYKPTENQQKWITILKQYEHEINNDLPFAEKETYEKLNKKFEFDEMTKFIIPQIVFLVFTTIGLFLLYKKRALINVQRWRGQLSWKIWILVIMSLSVHGLLVQSLYQFISLISGYKVYFAYLIKWVGGGATWISWILTILASMFVLSIIAYLCIKVIPKRQVLPFLIAGFMAGILSQYLWGSVVGPVLLPMP